MVTDDQVWGEREITQYVTEKAIHFFDNYFYNYCIMGDNDWEAIKEDFKKALEK